MESRAIFLEKSSQVRILEIIVVLCYVPFEGGEETQINKFAASRQRYPHCS